METKKCTECGRELPVTEFRMVGDRKGGKRALSICSDCMKKRQQEGRQKKYKKLEQEFQLKYENAKKLCLKDFTPRELMVELRDRGYKFKAEYVEVHIIDSDKL